MTLVKDAHEALSMLRNKSFDLVITDVHMPDMNGLELQDRINQDFSLPVICKYICTYVQINNNIYSQCTN